MLLFQLTVTQVRMRSDRTKFPRAQLSTELLLPSPPGLKTRTVAECGKVVVG